jgi:serine/threonine protein kinase
MGNIENMKNMKRELKIGMDVALDCEFLVQFKEYFVKDNCCFLIMELCLEGDLQKILDEKKILPEEV